MKIVPYDRFTLVTAKTPDEIAAALQPHVREPKWFRFHLGMFGKKPATRFEGKVDRDGFKIWPAIRYRNSFLPIIVGRLEPHLSGTKVEVTQRLHHFVLVFALFWVALILIVLQAVSAEPAPPGTIVPFDTTLLGAGMFAFVYLLAIGGFWWEARHTGAALSNILEARRDDGF